MNPAWCQVCICGRTFSVQQAYTYHKRSCEKTKKRLSGALEKAKEVWQANKRRRMEEKAAKVALGGPSHLDKVPVSESISATPSGSSEVRFLSCFATALTVSDN
jgi:hypothetical protein